MSNATVSSPEPAAAVEATKETVAQQAASAAATVVPPAPVKAPAVVLPGACVGWSMKGWTGGWGSACLL